MKTHASSPSLTLSHAFEQFLENSSFARRTRESYSEDLAPLFAEIGQKPVTALTADILQAFLARQESLAPATYNRRLAALRSFTRGLRDQGWAAEALLDGVQRKPEGNRAARALDAQKVESVLRKIEDPRDRALFWLIYDGGLRCQEALAIDIEDISWSDRSIRLHGKGDRPREMFFSRAVGTLLDKYLATRGDRTPTTLLVRLTGTSIQAWAGERQFAKEGSQADLVMSLASERLLAVRALALLFYILLDLLGSYDLLDTGQHLFGFGEPQPKRFWRECPSLEACDLSICRGTALS